VKKSALLILSLVFFISVANVYAANFRDVPSNHFAADAVRWVSSPANGSFMVGDASNNFNPNRTLDVFETAIIMAVAEGFRYMPGSLTPAEQAVFDRAYQRHSGLLSDLEVRHPNWRRAANREIAFLLERGILTEADLELFMTRAVVGGAETPAPLTKEMLSAFILRLSNNHEHEIDLLGGFSFNDDGDLSEMYRRYAYLAYQLGILSTYDGDFSPQRAITRAEFAQISYDLRISATAESLSLALPAEPEIPAASPTPEVEPALNPNPEFAQTASPFTDTLHGVISSVGETSIDIRTDEGLDTHRFASNTVVVTDDVRSNISDLREGMLVAIGVNNDREIISLIARSYQAAEVSLPPRGERPEVVLPPFITEGPALTIDPVPSPPFERLIPEEPEEEIFVPVFFRGEGVIAALPEGAIVINIHRLHIATGEITEEARRFTIANNAPITRGYSLVPTADIRIGEIVSFDYAGDMLYALRLPEEYIPPVVYGILEKIIITEGIYSVLLRVNESITELMTLPVEVYDIYALRLGMELRVSLDNQVIYDLEVLSQTDRDGGEGFIAYIQSLRHGHTIVVREEGRRHNVRVGGGTINTATGEPLRFRDLRSQMRLYIVLEENSDTATSVTILP